MRVLVFQHIACEHPGIFRDFMAEDGIEWQAVELDEGEPIPDLDAFDVLISMGGPMDVWQKDEHSWIKPELAAIRERWARPGAPSSGSASATSSSPKPSGARWGRPPSRRSG